MSATSPDQGRIFVMADSIGHFAVPTSTIVQCVDVLAEDGWILPLGDGWAKKALGRTPRLSRDVIKSYCSKE